MFRIVLRIGLVSLFLVGVVSVGAQVRRHPRDIYAGPDCSLLCLDADDDGRTAHLRQGELVKISLVGGRGTGARWHLEEVDPFVLWPLCDAFTPFRPDLVGGSGLFHCFYHATQPGETFLELKYYRGWEGSHTATNRFTLTIVVH